MSQRPSVGRVVHYAPSYGRTECQAAIVTEVDLNHSDRVGLAIFEPDGVRFVPLAHDGPDGRGGVVQDDDGRDHEQGTWHWPERV